MVLADVRIVGQVGVIRRQHRDMQALALGRLTNLYPAKAACPQADAVFNQRPVSFGAIQAILIPRAERRFPLRRAGRLRTRRGIDRVRLLAAFLPRNILRANPAHSVVILVQRHAAVYIAHPPHVAHAAAGHIVDVEVFQRDFRHPHCAVFALRYQIAVGFLPLHLHAAHLRIRQRIRCFAPVIVDALKAIQFFHLRIRQLKAVIDARELRLPGCALLRRLINGGRRINHALPTVCALFRRNQLIVIAALHDDARAILLPRIIIRQMIIVVIIIRVRHKRHQGLGQAPAVRGGNRHYHHHQGQNQQNPPFLHRSQLLWRYFPT